MRCPKAPIVGERTSVRRATEADAELLVGWHADPDVARFWDDTSFTYEQILHRLARPDVDAYIVEESGEPIGYVQAWFESGAADRGGLDMSLIPSARGRGLGPDAARTLARWLVGEAGVRRLTVDPYAWNSVAIRAWEKAGFRHVAARDTDDEHRDAWVLMRFDPAPVGGRAPMKP